MKDFLEQNRPTKVKEIYRALVRDHPEWSAEKKARIASAAYGKMLEKKAGDVEDATKAAAGIAGGIHGYRNASAFDPHSLFPGMAKGNNLKTRALSGVLGASLVSGIAGLPFAAAKGLRAVRGKKKEASDYEVRIRADMQDGKKRLRPVYRKIQRKSGLDRVIDSGPGIGAVGGAALAMRNSKGSLKQRAVQTAIGAGTGAGIGWIPATLRDAAKNLNPRNQMMKTSAFEESYFEELEKLAYAWTGEGAPADDYLSSGQIPFKRRRSEYEGYVKRKSREGKSTWGQAAGGGALGGAALGGLMGAFGLPPMRAQNVLGLAAFGGAVGALVGAGRKMEDDSEIDVAGHYARAGKTKNLADARVQSSVVRHGRRKEAGRYHTEERRHQELMEGLRKRASLNYGFVSALEKLAAGPVDGSGKDQDEERSSPIQKITGNTVTATSETKARGMPVVPPPPGYVFRPDLQQFIPDEENNGWMRLEDATKATLQQQQMMAQTQMAEQQMAGAQQQAAMQQDPQAIQQQQQQLAAQQQQLEGVQDQAKAQQAAQQQASGASGGQKPPGGKGPGGVKIQVGA